MNIGIILAAGKGTRYNSREVNKTSIEYLGKPLVVYGVELLESVCGETYVVIGFAGESVVNSLEGKKVNFVEQAEIKGTGSAVKSAVDVILKNGVTYETAFVGYGDHMMYYDADTLQKMLDVHTASESVITMVTTHHDEPDNLKWGRVIRNENGDILKIVEQKDATVEERKVTELNAGLYSFDWKFLKEEIGNIMPSEVSGEYYLTDLIGMAINKGQLVSGLAVPFEKVGLGINTQEEKIESELLYKKLQNSRKF